MLQFFSWLYFISYFKKFLRYNFKFQMLNLSLYAYKNLTAD